MLSSLLVLILLLVAAESTFPYPPFSGVNHYSRIENMVDTSDLQNRINNEVVGCDMEAILNVIGLEELQHVIETLAAKKGVNPFLVLRKLIRRMRNKEEIEETMINTLDGPPLPQLLNQPIIDLKPAIKLTPESSRAPYSLAPNVVMNDDSEDTKVVIIPVSQSALDRTPVIIKPENKPRKETSLNSVSPLVGKLNNILPGVFLSPVRSHPLRPPLGATVRVNSGDPHNPINRDIVVTVSPLMTLIEALRQAEIKYQNILGTNPDADIITFAHSADLDCFVVNSIDKVTENQDFGWKVIVMDKDGEVVYDSFCLPNGKDVLVKPGTLISLIYVPL